MKKAILYTLLFASVALSQTNQVVQAGVKNFFGPNVLFGGNNFLAIGSGTDTVSDFFPANIGLVRPGTFVAIEFKGISADSAASAFSILLESRTCPTATSATGCPTQWLTRENRTLLNDQHFADSMYIAKVPEDTTQKSASTLIPTGNQWRIRVKGSAALDSNYTNFWTIGGY